MKKISIALLLLVCLNSFSQEYIYSNWNFGKELINITRYQSGIPEEIILNLPEDIEDGIFSAPLNYLDQLVHYLVSWTDDNYLKIKSIHDWIVCNIPYDIAAYNNGEIKNQLPYITLRFRTAVCGGYSTLFNYMARQASFECEYVSGYTKGRSKYAIQPMGQFVRHAWNCIKINDIWYLIDTTWDAGYVDGNRFIFAYTTDFFLTDPTIFIRRHYPQAPGFLLLDNYVSIDDFRNINM
jgi:hypothetical protein